MKKFFIFFAAIFFFGNVISAQHCPFDGSAMIVIKVTDKNGKPVTDLKSSILLYEMDNPRADSCTYAAGRLSVPFKEPKQSLIEKYNNTWKSWATRYSSDCSFMEPGHYAVVLNQAQAHCMLKNETWFTYVERNFEIRLQKADSVKTLANVSRENIYSLCTSAGKWSRIAALEIKLAD